jgi:hypothetical protein
MNGTARNNVIGRLVRLSHLIVVAAIVPLIADFLFSKVIGKGPMYHAKCIEYWGLDVEACGSSRSRSAGA